MKVTKVTAASMKHVRSRLELSQVAMGNLVGVDWHTICRWENGGKPNSPIWAELYRLLHRALKLGIDPKEIVELSDSSVGRLRFYRKLGNLVVEHRSS